MDKSVFISVSSAPLQSWLVRGVTEDFFGGRGVVYDYGVTCLQGKLFLPNSCQLVVGLHRVV